jgi:hypothetical protein
MKLRRTAYFALAAMLAITLTGLAAHAQDLNLSDAQVFKIQALLQSQTKELRTLNLDVQSSKDALNAAIAKGDPVLTAMAVLSLDASEKALKNTQAANQRHLLSLLNEFQKQVVKDSSKSIPATE